MPNMEKLPVSHHPSISVCFPAYNEEATIEGVVNEAYQLLEESGLDYEIIVCDDGSQDRTRLIITNVAGRVTKIRLLIHDQNLGIRYTFEELYSNATKEFVFLNSVDRQWRTEILFEMLPLTKNWDIIIASRIHKPYSLLRNFISWSYNTIPYLLFGVKTHDAGAVKLIRREIIQRFTLVSKSPFAEAERLIRAHRAGYRITIYPVSTSRRKTGIARGVNCNLIKEALCDVFRVWYDLRISRSV